MTLVILQPGYIPWLGFFDQMNKADLFVIYDDVQFDKHGWRNRNRIRTKDGWMWLSVPVLSSGKPLLKDTMIENKHNWRKKHLASILQNYGKTPYFGEYFDKISNILSRPHERLIDLDMALILLFKEILNIDTPSLLSSNLSTKGKATQRIQGICKELGADEYLSGDAGSNYLDEKLFSENGIKLKYHNYDHPKYRQLYSPFLPYLSVVDLIFNCGKESVSVLNS